MVFFSRCRRDHARDATIRLFREPSHDRMGHIEFTYERPSQPKFGTILSDLASDKPPITKEASQASPSTPRSLQITSSPHLMWSLFAGLADATDLGLMRGAKHLHLPAQRPQPFRQVTRRIWPAIGFGRWDVWPTLYMMMRERPRLCG